MDECALCNVHCDDVKDNSHAGLCVDECALCIVMT